MTFFDLKSILSLLSIAYPLLFWFPFVWSISFNFFTFRLCVSTLKLKLLCCRQHRVESWFFFFSVQPLYIIWLYLLLSPYYCPPILHIFLPFLLSSWFSVGMYFYKYIFIYLAVLDLSCSIQDIRCIGQDILLWCTASCGAWAL